MSEQAQPQDPQREVVRLVGANVPADQGLSSLGLLLQLGGGLSAAFVSFVGFIALLTAGRGVSQSTLWVLLLTVLSLVRSLMHRAAGTELLYGPQPLRGIRRYIVVALAHALLFAVVLANQSALPGRLAFGVGLGLATWPLILAALLRLPRLSRFEDELPPPEDKGFEGASVLMTILSVAGLGFGALMLKGFFALPNAMGGLGVLTMLTLVMLIARSIAHLSAGLAGLRSTSLDTAVDRVGRYANLGIISAFVASGVLLLSMMSARADFAGMLFIAIVGWVLAIWPMALRRFFAERQFANLLAGDAAPIHRRAPDAGLTALGWLLIAMGGFAASFSVIGLVGGAAFATDASSAFELAGLPLSQSLPGSSWWSLLTAALQLVAGIELIRMSARHRIVATVAGCAIAIIQLGVVWPIWGQVSSLGWLHDGRQLGIIAGLLLPMGIAFSTVILVNRKIAPMATATVRRSAADA